MADINIGGTFHSTATGNIVARADEIQDTSKNKKQNTINAEIDTALADRYTKSETYSKTELNNLITTPNQQYVTVATYAGLPATGSADTVYRVANYDGGTSAIDATKYSEYAWNGSVYILLAVKPAIAEVFDVSEYNATGGTYATYAGIAEAATATPQAKRASGMTIKYLDSTTNKYIEYRYLNQYANTTAGNNAFVNTANWEKINNVSISQNTSTGHTDINIGSDSYSVASAEEVNQLGQEVGKVAIPINGYNTRIVTSGGVGAQIPQPTAYSGVNYSKFTVIPGDLVFINGTGGNAARLWAFVDADGYILSMSESNVTATNKELIVPENAAEIVINTSDTSIPSYYFAKNSCQYRLNKLDEKTDYLENEIKEDATAFGLDEDAALQKLGASASLDYSKIDVTPQSYLNGYYRGKIDTDGYTVSTVFKSAIIPVLGCKAIIITGKSVENNYRVFDESGDEILRDSGAYFSLASNGIFTLPASAYYFSFVYNANTEPAPSGMKVYRGYYQKITKIVDSLELKNRNFIVVQQVRPNDAATAFEAASAPNLDCFCIPVFKDDEVIFDATYTQSKNIRFCFSHYLPYVGCAISDADYRTSSSAHKEAIAPYDGYFVIYHHQDYFTDQKCLAKGVFFSGKVIMEGGAITNGVPDCYTSSRSDYINSMRTPRYIRADKILPILLESGETCKIWCYDDGLNVLGYTTDGSVKTGTKWVKIVITNSNGFASSAKVITVTGTNGVGTLIEKFNTNLTSSLIANINFSFEVQIPPEPGNEDTVINERHFDNGTIRLPYNYSPDGAPVQLAVFWHGTGGYNFTNPGLSYASQMNFLLANGFAVCDCSGMTDKYQIGSDAVSSHDCRFNPLAIACFCALYNYVTRNFNLRSDGAFVFGKSNGGLGAAWLASMKPFPIKAAASLAGSLSVPESMRYSTVDNLNYWCARLGMTGYTFNYTGYYFQHENEDGNTFIINNADKYKMYDPMVLMSSIDEAEFVTEAFESGYLEQDTDGMWAIINQGRKIMPSPFKIFHAVDDTDVPIVISRFFKKLVDRTNGVCILREIPAGYGAHHAVDNSELAPQVSVQTKYAGQQTIVQTYAELVEWFNRWL